MVRVEVRNLVKYFYVSRGNIVKAADNVSFTVEDGEFFTFLGPSGCGKTTTLRCIAGLEVPEAGEIYIGDRLVNHFPPSKRGVSMVFQDYALYPFMNVFDNIAFYLKLRHLPKAKAKTEVKEAAELLHIEKLLDRKIDQLSGGQMQRVAVARALVAKPLVYLMDEPLANLDQKIRIEMRSELKKLFRKLDVTVIYVTHDQGEAISMSDRIAVMNEGKIVQLDTPAKIYDSPETLFTAGFIGSHPMNFIDCNLVQEDEQFVFYAGETSLNFPSIDNLLRQVRTQKVVLGIRPENISVTRKKGHIKAKVDLIEPSGNKKHITFVNGRYVRIKVEVDPETRMEIGQEVELKFNERKVGIFEERTGKRLI